MKEVVDQFRRAMAPTVMDRVVGYFMPERGLKRLQARTMLNLAAGDAGGYGGGRRDSRALRRWRPTDASADRDILPDLPDLRGRSRDLARNAPLATGAVATVVTNVVGEGLQLQASIDSEALGMSPEAADAWERQAEREFAMFCRTADWSGVQSFEEMQSLIFRSVLESGDAVIVRRNRKNPGDAYGTKMMVLEADRLSNPDRAGDTEQIAGGVEFDQNGMPIAYHISNKHPGDLRSAGLAWKRIPARTAKGKRLVLHLYDRMRPEQSRGVPYLAPVIEHLKQLSSYSESEVRAAVLQACFTVFIKSNVSPSQILETDDDGGDRDLKMGDGAILQLREGEDITLANPARPNANFDPFFLAITRQIGVALELPQELLIKHFTASYSASRAALEMAWQFFRRRRAWLAGRLCQEIYEWCLEEAVAEGRLAAPGFFENERVRQAYCWAEWRGPRRPSLNPKQEAEADEIDVRLGVTTREQICLERTGGEVEDKIRQLGKERKLLDDAGISAEQTPAASPAQNPHGDPADGSDAEDETEARRSNA